MKVKSWLRYLIYISIITTIVYLAQYIFGYIKNNPESTININPYLIYALKTIIYMVIGSILGLEHLVFQIKKEGTWRVNLPKIVLMVIPSLYFALAVIIYYFDSLFTLNILSYPLGRLVRNQGQFISVFQLIFGYTLTTSFYKKSK